MNNTRNKCKTLRSRILQPPLIQFSIYTSACSACQVVPCSRKARSQYLSCCFLQYVFFLGIHGISVKHVVNGKYYVTTVQIWGSSSFQISSRLHTYCLHSRIVACATWRSTCQVLTRFRQQGSKTSCGVPQLNSDVSIGLFVSNIRNQCKTF